MKNESNNKIKQIKKPKKLIKIDKSKITVSNPDGSRDFLTRTLEALLKMDGDIYTLEDK